MKAPRHYREQMKQRYPSDWPIEAFTFWVDYFWQHGKEPTLEQWKKHKTRRQAFRNYKEQCVRDARGTGRKALKLLYNSLGVSK